jgi:hypothetical protein
LHCRTKRKNVGPVDNQGGIMRGAVRSVLLVAAVVFFIVAIIVDSSPQDWLALGLIFLTCSQLTDITDLDFTRARRN